MHHNGWVPEAPQTPPRPMAPAGQPNYPARSIAGRYRLDRVLGKGSMGTVWAAYDETLHRRVAIKEINFPSGLPDHERHMLIERTLREARAIAQLSHPNVITLYDILTLDSGPVIVMEVLAARSLGEVLKEVGPLTDGQAATVGLTVASGLSAAHAAGITHRDVKPGNVLIGGDGRIKLTDFGIARSAAENPMTATGLLLGSPAYIAPEVASGSTAGPPADAWGLGALLFASLEGRPPFDKGSPVATLMSVVTDPVPPMVRGGRLTPVIEGLLNKDPRHRMGLAEARSRLSGIASDPVEGRLIFPPTTSAQRPTTPGRSGSPQYGGTSGQYRPPTMTSGSAAHHAPLPPVGWQPGHGASGGYEASGGRPGAGSLPPPPWAAQGVAHLAPLPPAGAPSLGAPGSGANPAGANPGGAGSWSHSGPQPLGSTDAQSSPVQPFNVQPINARYPSIQSANRQSPHVESPHAQSPHVQSPQLPSHPPQPMPKAAAPGTPMRPIPQKSPKLRKSATARPTDRILVAIAVVILAAALGFWGVRLIVEAVANNGAAVVAVQPVQDSFQPPV